MIRNLKALGLALVAVFAMSAVVASAASAQTTDGKLTMSTPVTLTATETGEPKDNQFTAFGASIRCPGSSFDGHRVNWTPHTLLQSGDSAATLSPTFTETKAGAPNCSAAGLGWSVTVDENGCDFDATLGETTGGGETYGVTAKVTCPQGQEITVTMWTTEALHTSEPNNPFCVIHIGETGNTNLVGAHATNTSGGHIGIHGTFENITATKTASASHPVLCAEATTTTAKFAIDVTVQGEAGGEAVPISITH